MNAPNIFWLQLDKDRIIKKETISDIRWDRVEKRYEIKIDGGVHYFDKEIGDKIVKSLGAD